MKFTELVLGLFSLAVMAGELAHVMCLWALRALTMVSALADKRYFIGIKPAFTCSAAGSFRLCQ
jgi:hypothetical protein